MKNFVPVLLFVLATSIVIAVLAMTGHVNPANEECARRGGRVETYRAGASVASRCVSP